MISRSLTAIFVYWGFYALDVLLKIPAWDGYISTTLAAILYWMFFIGTLVWIGAAVVAAYLTYGLLKGKNWSWTASVILSTFSIIIFAIMLVAFMAALIVFQDVFSITGLITVTLALFIDLAIIFLLTRPGIKTIFIND